MGAWNIRTSTSKGVDLEVLKNPVNAEVADSIVLDASTVAADTDGIRKLVAGTPVSKNVNNQYEKFTGAAGQVCAGILTTTELFPDGTSASDTPAAMWNHGQYFRADRIVGWGTLAATIKAALPTCKFG